MSVKQALDGVGLVAARREPTQKPVVTTITLGLNVTIPWYYLAQDPRALSTSYLGPQWRLELNLRRDFLIKREPIAAFTTLELRLASRCVLVPLQDLCPIRPLNALPENCVRFQQRFTRR